jgi:hypothetical protein
MSTASNIKIDINFISTITTLTTYCHQAPIQIAASLLCRSRLGTHDRITAIQTCIDDTNDTSLANT